MNSFGKLQLLRALLIISAGCWVFAPALHGDWLWDDTETILQNSLVHDPSGLWKIWLQPGLLRDYLPLTVSVEWIEWHLWHENTLGYHLVNLLLHLSSALLVWRLFARLGMRLAWLGGLIFAIHPLTVESVAWIAELKNTLSLPLFLLAICSWIDYDEHGRRSDYLLALGLFLAAMLCKTTMALFPVVILLYAWWKQSRVGGKDFKATVPFFGVSLVLGIVTILFQKHQIYSPAPLTPGGILSSAALAAASISFYFTKSFLPIGLLPIYPDPIPFSPIPLAISLTLLAAIFWLWTKRAGWGKHALLGLGFFLINLVPVFGIIAIKYTVMIWSMDHMAYLPIIGLIGLVVAALGQIEAQLPSTLRTVGTLAVVAVLAMLAFGSHQYASIYQSEETLWTYTLGRNPMTWSGHTNLGNYEFETGRVSEAIEQYQEALQVNPLAVETHNNLGIALNYNHRPEEAVVQFEAALKINPTFALGQVNLATTLMHLGRIPEAIDHYKEALKFDPHNQEALDNLAKLESAK